MSKKSELQIEKDAHYLIYGKMRVILAKDHPNLDQEIWKSIRLTLEAEHPDADDSVLKRVKEILGIQDEE